MISNTINSNAYRFINYRIALTISYINNKLFRSMEILSYIRSINIYFIYAIFHNNHLL